MIYWTQDFTAANGSDWSEVGFDRVAGAALNAVIQSNAGQHGALAGFRIYMSSGWPPTRDFKVDVLVDWNNPTVQGRSAGIAGRLTADGQTCYWGELSSYKPSGGSIGTPHVRLFRRRSGTNTIVVAETDISGTVSAADLAAGVRLGLRIKNTAEGEVNVQLQVDRGSGFVTHATYVDTSVVGSIIEEHGGVGIVLDALSVTNDIVYDDFRCRDFSDEAADIEYEEGLAIILNGEYYDAEQVEALGLSGLKARQSYAIRADGEVTDLADIHNPTLLPGDDISIMFDNTVLAVGVIRPVMKSGRIPSEGVSYEIHGPKMLCQGVTVTHPVTGAGQITFNPDSEEPNYDAGYANKSPGDILTWLYENHTEGQDGLRAHRAAPAYLQTVTIPAGLMSGPVIPQITVSGDFASAVEMVLSYMPGWAWWVDPETKEHFFHERPVASKVDIDCADDWIEFDIEVHPELNRTAVLIRGSEPEIEMETLSLSGGTLAGEWDTGLETTWTNNVSRRSRAVGTVSAVGGSPPTIDPDQTGGLFPMEVDEWLDSVLTFTSGAESGNSYQVTSNTLVRLYLYGAAFLGAGPAPGDTFVVEDKQSNPGTPDSADPAWAARYNGNFSVYREFGAAGAFAGIEIAEGKCFDIRITTPIPGGLDDQFEVRHVGGQVIDGKIVLDSPATLPLGLVNYTGGRTGDVCEPGGAEGVGQAYGDIEVDVPKRNTVIPSIRKPVLGFHGTAYSLDPDKWDGVGEAGYGDAGVRTVLVVDDPNFNSLAFQTEYEAFADSLLEIYGSLAVMAKVDYNDKVVTSWAGLNKRITLSDTEAPRTTGYETSDDLWLAEVEWDLTEWKTSLNIGSIMAFGGVNLQAVRQRYAETNRMKQWRDAMRKHADFLNCLKTGFESSTASEITGSQGVCASQISAGGGQSVQDALEHTVTASDIPSDCASAPCPAGCDGIISNKPQMLTNADDAIAVRPVILKPNGSYALPGAGGGQPAGDWIENVVACLQSHVDGLWTTLHDQTTAIEAAFKSVEDCWVQQETNNAALWAAILALYACHNATHRSMVATFATVAPGAGVPVLVGNPALIHCPVPTEVVTTCGPVCECQIAACPVDCNP